jgi:hypothetical protein
MKYPGKAPRGRVVIVQPHDPTELFHELRERGADLDMVTICSAAVRPENPDGSRGYEPMTLRDHDYWNAFLDRSPDTVLLLFGPLEHYLTHDPDRVPLSQTRREIAQFVSNVIRPRRVTTVAAASEAYV